jgi:hypothetical protein
MRIEVGGNRLDEQLTTKMGFRKAVSLGGSVTGHGADLIIVDDLLKAMDAISPVERQRCKDFYEQTLISRLNDKQRGRIIVIRQRLHEDDLPRASDCVRHVRASGSAGHCNPRRDDPDRLWRISPSAQGYPALAREGAN